MATSGDYQVNDDDRLPWLETVDEDYSEGTSIVRVGLFVLLGLVAIAAIIFGFYWYQQHRGLDGKGALIAAQEGDYKVKPDNPGGMKVEGEGDTAFATSEGKKAGDAKIDVKKVPEAPVTKGAASASGGALIQLGSFPDEASANAAWAKSSKRFAYLAPLGKSVESATVNGKTVYRLRVNAGSASQASELCGKLKVAGEACFVAKN